MKMTSVLEPLDVAGELAQRLTHQARVQTHVVVAHLAFDFGLRRQRRDRVDHHHIDCVGTHQHVGDFQRLLASVGLRHQKIVDIHAKLARVGRIQRMFGIHERRGAAILLATRDHLQGERGLARRFRAVDFHHAPARQAADAQRHVEAQRTRGNHVDGLGRAIAHAHHRALAELLLDLAQSGSQCAALVVIHRGTLD